MPTLEQLEYLVAVAGMRHFHKTAAKVNMNQPKLKTSWPSRRSKNFPTELAKIRARFPKGVEIELWWQDEARIGQKNKVTRRWARRGTRPSSIEAGAARSEHQMGLHPRRDLLRQRQGRRFGQVMPWCDTHAMEAYHLVQLNRGNYSGQSTHTKYRRAQRGPLLTRAQSHGPSDIILHSLCI